MLLDNKLTSFERMRRKAHLFAVDKVNIVDLTYRLYDGVSLLDPIDHPKFERLLGVSMDEPTWNQLSGLVENDSRRFDMTADMRIRLTFESYSLLIQTEKGFSCDMRSGNSVIDPVIPHLGDIWQRIAWYCHDVLAYNLLATQEFDNHVLYEILEMRRAIIRRNSYLSFQNSESGWFPFSDKPRAKLLSRIGSGFITILTGAARASISSLSLVKSNISNLGINLASKVVVAAVSSVFAGKWYGTPKMDDPDAVNLNLICVSLLLNKARACSSIPALNKGVGHDVWHLWGGAEESDSIIYECFFQYKDWSVHRRVADCSESRLLQFSNMSCGSRALV